MCKCSVKRICGSTMPKYPEMNAKVPGSQRAGTVSMCCFFGFVFAGGPQLN
jgi:hypothetical protein